MGKGTAFLGGMVTGAGLIIGAMTLIVMGYSVGEEAGRKEAKEELDNKNKEEIENEIIEENE